MNATRRYLFTFHCSHRSVVESYYQGRSLQSLVAFVHRNNNDVLWITILDEVIVDYWFLFVVELKLGTASYATSVRAKNTVGEMKGRHDDDTCETTIATECVQQANETTIPTGMTTQDEHEDPTTDKNARTLTGMKTVIS
jgi:hypothetical protein